MPRWLITAVILGFLDYGVAQPRILDVGCGHGRLTRLLARFGFSDYLGIDFSVQAVQRAEALSIPDARFEVTDMNHWDTTDRFDAVVLNESLYYADHPLQVFERALGWLTEDGIVIVSMFEPTPGASRNLVADHVTRHRIDRRDDGDRPRQRERLGYPSNAPHPLNDRMEPGGRGGNPFVPVAVAHHLIPPVRLPSTALNSPSVFLPGADELSMAGCFREHRGE